jgi:hypothetical protein
MSNVWCCVASGPSLTLADCDAVTRAGIPVIAVNDSWRMAPNCRALMAADLSWWAANSPRITCNAERWTADHFTAKRFGLQLLPHPMPGPFNSGQRAIELAISKGAQRIILLGYDCSLANGIHWHGLHRHSTNPDPESVAKWEREFSRLRRWVRDDVEILNASRHTELKIFPRTTLNKVLCAVVMRTE